MSEQELEFNENISDYKTLIDDYIKNSSKYAYMHESIRECIAKYKFYNYDYVNLVTVSIYIPFCKNKGEYFFEVVPEYMKDWEEVELTQWLLEEACHWYFREMADYGAYYNPFENPQNILPKWNDDFLPDDSDNMKDILKNHTWSSRIEYLLDNYDYKESFVRRKFSLSDKKYNALKISLPKKLTFGIYLTKHEEAIVEYIIKRDEKPLFPYNMSEKQIKNAIRTAYEDARKESKRQMPTLKDIKNMDCCVWDKTLYQGKAGDLIIRFWFDFAENKIVAAYPI